MTDAPLLTIAYSTLATRAHRISPPALAPDVDILVCVQGGSPTGDGELAGARIVPVPGAGVAKSRNASIEHARGRYLLFCDDDVTVYLPGVVEGVRYLQLTGHALALGQGMDPSGALRKKYPRFVTPLSTLNSAKAATYEMLIDVSQVRAMDVRFDTRFGAGTDLHLGDEYIFIADLLRAGLRCDAVPLIFGTHPILSSGARWGSAADSHARAVALNRVFGRWAPLARMAFGVKNYAKFGDLRTLLAFLADGSPPPAAEPAPWRPTVAPGAPSDV